MGKKADALKEELVSREGQVESLSEGLENALRLMSKAARAKWDATTDEALVQIFTGVRT